MGDMNLQTWLNHKKLDIAELVEMTGFKYETVRTHLRGLRSPRDSYKKIYFQISNGEVTPNDFIDLTNLTNLTKSSKTVNKNKLTTKGGNNEAI